MTTMFLKADRQQEFRGQARATPSSTSDASGPIQSVPPTVIPVLHNNSGNKKNKSKQTIPDTRHQNKTKQQKLNILADVVRNTCISFL